MILWNATGFISVCQGLVVEMWSFSPFLLGLRDNRMTDRKAYNSEHPEKKSPSPESVKKSLGKIN